MKRTVKLATLPLNRGKRDQIRSLQRAYAQFKDRFLVALAPASAWHLLDNKFQFRNFAKSHGLYQRDLNTHLVDQAAFDAVDTWVRHIESVLTRSDIRAKVWQRFTDEHQRHYAYSLLRQYGDIGAVLQGRVPERPKIPLDHDAYREVCRFLRRHLRNAFSHSDNPRSRTARSIGLDDTMYTSFMVEGGNKRRQYVSMIGVTKGKRILIPLSGVSRVSGNIRLVMDDDDDRAYVHVVYDMKQSEPATGPAKAIDWGITEVATDNKGRRYGEGYGEVLQRISDELTTKGRRRNKLHALSKKYAGSKKARRIARHNLGTKKQARRRAEARATLQTVTGCAVKEIVYGDGNRTRARGRRPQHPAQRPSLIVHEDLAHLRGKAKSKRLSRLTSAWMRSELEIRMVVHASRGSSSTKAVNAAYTSQTCPEPSCGYVSSENRKSDMFHCRNPYWACDWQGGADQVAAMNLLARAGDREITSFTPYTKVKSILVERFQRRLESRTEGASAVHQTSVDGYATAHGRTPSTPQQRFAVVGGTAGADSQGPVHPAGTGATLRLESEKKRNT